MEFVEKRVTHPYSVDAEAQYLEWKQKKQKFEESRKSWLSGLMSQIIADPEKFFPKPFYGYDKSEILEFAYETKEKANLLF